MRGDNRSQINRGGLWVRILRSCRRQEVLGEHVIGKGGGVEGVLCGVRPRALFSKPCG